MRTREQRTWCSTVATVRIEMTYSREQLDYAVRVALNFSIESMDQRKKKQICLNA